MVIPGTPPIPHVGGPVTIGSTNVLIGGMAAARVGDMLMCPPVGPTDSITSGSPTVLINSMPAARLGDPTAHGGVIVVGCPTVIIGASSNAGAGGAGMAKSKEKQPGPPAPLASGQALREPKRQAEVLRTAARDGTPFCEACQRGAQ
jgi:uncharacterized Zn-binding protein involved in type VI secretion